MEKESPLKSRAAPCLARDNRQLLECWCAMTTTRRPEIEQVLAHASHQISHRTAVRGPLFPRFPRILTEDAARGAF